MVAMAAFVLALGLVVSTVLRADGPGGPSREQPTPTTASRPRQAPTAEDILRTLRQRRPPNDVIPPGSSSADPPLSDRPNPDALLWPEGSSWVEKTGRLERDGDWWRLVCESDATAPPIRVLPNTNLEVLVRTLLGGSAANLFTVSGEVTVFQGANYLLVRSAARAAPPAAAPPNGPNEKKPPSVDGRPRTDAPADQVLDRMRARQPDNALLGEDAAPMTIDPSAPGPFPTAHLLLDGTPIVRRVGRVTRREAAWIFTSDSDHANASDAPLRLLPNQSLEAMVKELQGGGGGGLIFTLSGEATLFFGENYLLPRVATRRVDLGNLRR